MANEKLILEIKDLGVRLIELSFELRHPDTAAHRREQIKRIVNVIKERLETIDGLMS
jgi:hypothetical protein